MIESLFFIGMEYIGETFLYVKHIKKKDVIYFK